MTLSSDAGAAAVASRLKQHPFMLAPMAGVTDTVYRQIAYDHGCYLAFTEMVSVAGLAHASLKTWDLVTPGPDEPRIAVQLFGGRPEQFEPAVQAVIERLDTRLVAIDINMACPVPKVFKKGEGCALMGAPDVARQCVEGAVRGANGRVPVTCKIRSGISSGTQNAVEFAKMLADAGASCVAVHGRTASQLYRGKADWGVIANVVRAVDVPVVGSGDVFEPTDAVSMLQQTGCAGVFVARGSYGNPWIFSRTQTLFETGDLPEAPSVALRLDTLREHIVAYGRRGMHMARLRPVVGWYVKGLPAASVWRGRAMACSDVEDYLRLVDAMHDACVEHGLI